MKLILNLTCIFFVVFPPALKAETIEVAAIEALEFCLDMPSDQDQAIDQLGVMGWTRATDDDGQTIYQLLYSLMFVNDHRPDDLDYTYKNSHFMAASTLGNSALLPNQPAFTKGEIRLGVLGIREGTPYCVLSGPKSITPPLEKKFGITLNDALPYLRSFAGDVGQLSVAIHEIDKEKFHLQPHNIQPDDLAGYREFEQDALHSTNVYVIPKVRP